MFKMLKDNFNITNDCMILATPLVLFFIITQWYVQTFQIGLLNDYHSTEYVSIANYVLFFITLWVWISGCFSGWFYMVKKTLQYSRKTFLFDKDRNAALRSLLYCLFKGIGKFFIPFLVLLALYFIFKIIKIMILLEIFYNFDYTKINLSLVSVISISIMVMISFFFVYVVPEIVYSYSNAFKALLNSVKKVCMTFKEILPVYGLFILIGFILKLLFIYSVNYPVLYFFLMLVTYYFVLYSVLLVFSFYERKFVQ